MSFFLPLPETQVALAISIFVGTLVYEDGATVLAATLSASGRLDPALGLLAAFVGIWVGDIGLYAMGSTLGHYTEKSRRLQKFLKPESLTKTQAWFARHGSMALVLSRAIPGSRLPLYLAAGALRLPLRQFVRITGICAGIWVSAIFAVWKFVPTGPGKMLPWILTAIMLLVPWLLGKMLIGKRLAEKSLGPFIRRAQTGERAPNQSLPSICAL
jgi:membrane protein DedA with SNARE-associated domain